MSPEFTIDVCHWISRATFDVIGIAGELHATFHSVKNVDLPTLGFDYAFNAIDGESNELFSAYKEMFEVTLALGNPTRDIIRVYFPFIDTIFVNIQCVTLSSRTHP